MAGRMIEEFRSAGSAAGAAASQNAVDLSLKNQKVTPPAGPADTEFQPDMSNQFEGDVSMGMATSPSGAPGIVPGGNTRSRGSTIADAMNAQQGPLRDAAVARVGLENKILEEQGAKLERNRIAHSRQNGKRRQIAGARFSGTLAPGANTSGSAMNAGVTAAINPTRNLSAETTIGAASDPNSLAARLASSSTARIAGEQTTRAANIAAAGQTASRQGATVAADIARRPADAPAMPSVAKTIGTAEFQGQGKPILSPTGKVVGSSFVPADPAGYSKAKEVRQAYIKKQTTLPWNTAGTPTAPVAKPQIAPTVPTASAFNLSQGMATAAAPNTVAGRVPQFQASSPTPAVASNPGIIPSPEPTVAQTFRTGGAVGVIGQAQRRASEQLATTNNSTTASAAGVRSAAGDAAGKIIKKAVAVQANGVQRAPQAALTANRNIFQGLANTGQAAKRFAVGEDPAPAGAPPQRVVMPRRPLPSRISQTAFNSRPNPLFSSR